MTMFRKLQLQMTLSYTLILVSILLVTNLFIYFLLQTYNDSQMSSESDKMLSTLDGSASAWLTDTEFDPDDEGGGISVPSPDDEVDEEEQESDTTQSSENTQDEKSVTANPQHIEGVGDLIVPSALKSFSFFMIFDTDGSLVSHGVNNKATLALLLDMMEQVPTDGQPIVYVLENGPMTKVQLLKRPIVVNDITYGSYCVGRDLTLVAETMRNLLRIMMIAFFIGMLASALIGYLIAGRALKPVQDAYETKQRFLADASHELRTPISVVLLSAESLDRELHPDQEEARQNVRDIREESFRMRDLVERLLFLARADSMKLPAKKADVDITDILHKAAGALEIMAFDKQIKLVINCQPNLICQGDQKMLASLFTVLIDNGIKYTPPHGQVGISGREVKIGGQTWLEVKVTDTGIGIPEKDFAKIFERFYRSDPSRTLKTGGHGLGLAIAKEIAQAHHGSIGVASQLNSGSVFTVRLPKKA
jgi:signal transduction histidine kinase